jgi:hypothetical protein
MEEAKKEVETIINETVEDTKHIIIRLLVYIRNWFLYKSTCQKE